MAPCNLASTANTVAKSRLETRATTTMETRIKRSRLTRPAASTGIFLLRIISRMSFEQMIQVLNNRVQLRKTGRLVNGHGGLRAFYGNNNDYRPENYTVKEKIFISETSGFLELFWQIIFLFFSFCITADPYDSRFRSEIRFLGSGDFQTKKIRSSKNTNFCVAFWDAVLTLIFK